MALSLVRAAHSVDVYDASATRDWLKDRIRQEIRLKGQPHPKILLIGDGHEEWLDLDAMAKQDRGADIGATFQLLKGRPHERRFIVLQLAVEDDAGAEHWLALLFEEIATPDEALRWWVALQEYRMDPVTELGHPIGEWQDSPFETSNPADLMPYLRGVVAPPPGARPATVLAPQARQPDIQAAFGELPPDVAPPADARAMTELVASFAVNDLLTGAIKGVVVFRIAGRAWEAWLLGDDQPAELEDMVRYAANRRAPPADGIGIAMAAVRPQDDPPVPGLQIIGELGGRFVEAWAPLVFTGGPADPKRIDAVLWHDPRPVPEGGMWLGVDPVVLFELGMLGPEA